ncbi:armadillo-type protein [Scenedesmus sp. NREL 46B-D3]|nr:armadillo-type protein [Scenedesmus sp. NREL 46B-D3]
MEAVMLNAEVEKQLAHLQSEDLAVQGRALAMITVLFSRCDNESQVSAVAAAVPSLYSCLESSDQLVQANACAAITAAAALDDQLAASVAAHSTKQLASMLQQCCSGGRTDLQLNVVSALGQLARDQQLTAKAVMEPQVLPCLLMLADGSQPAKLQEAVADCLCALASKDWAKQQLCTAGAATAARGLLNMQQLEVSVRCLMVLGMLLSSSADAQQQLADDAAALQQLMELVKQNEDADCKVIARDVLGLLMREEGLRRKVEAAIRQQAEAAAAAAAQQG